MDSIYKIDLSEISERIFFRYYPAWFFLFLIICLFIFLSDGFTVFIAALASCFFWTLIIYLISIIPIVVFKPARSCTRRLAMILSMLIFAWLNCLLNDVLVNLSPSINTGPFSISDFEIIACLNNLSIGSYICWIFYIEEKQYIAEMMTMDERNKRINNEKRLTETHLKILQAQIEPHFLFNTLTSILTLGKKDPKKAKIMQKNFIRYLKTTLSKTRESITTIGHEIELVEAYLDIFKVRMGKRLLYRVEFDKEVRNIPFPSMLIQPIVENAIKHGLEPKIDGGEINIKIAMVEGGRIRWRIEDTGLGMSDKANKGTGLSNTLERMKSLYGNEGRLTIMDNQPTGVKVTLEMPYA